MQPQVRKLNFSENIRYLGRVPFMTSERALTDTETAAIRLFHLLVAHGCHSSKANTKDATKRLCSLKVKLEAVNRGLTRQLPSKSNLLPLLYTKQYLKKKKKKKKCFKIKKFLRNNMSIYLKKSMLVFCLLRRAVRRENPPRWSFNAAPSPPERQKQEEEMAWCLPLNSSDSLFTRRRRRRESRGMRLACTDDSFSSGAAPRPF